jgi:hypothetical protein
MLIYLERESKRWFKWKVELKKEYNVPTLVEELYAKTTLKKKQKDYTVKILNIFWVY